MNSRHERLVDKTHINDVFDTSTMIMPLLDGTNSPHKSAIIPRQECSSSGGSDQEIKKLKEAMFNEVHDRSALEDPSTGGGEAGGPILDANEYYDGEHTPHAHRPRHQMNILSEGAQVEQSSIKQRDSSGVTPTPGQSKPPVETRARKTIGHYSIEKSIGEGTFGKVKLGSHHITGEKVAIKILEKDRITDVSDVERVAREIHILKLIRHPNII